MTANQKISLALLIGRLITVFIMAHVIRKQHGVLKAKNYPELNTLRKTLLLGSIIILLGNTVPIIIDVMGVLGKGSFSLLLAYVFSNNIIAIFSAYMLWYNISLSEKIKLINHAAVVKEARKLANSENINEGLQAQLDKRG